MQSSIPFKDPHNEIKLFTRRAIAIGIIIGILSLALVLRLFYLQVYQHTLYKTLSQKNLLSVNPLEPTRGLIYDRQGKLIAENIPVFSLEIIPNRIQHLNTVLADLSRIISLSDEQLRIFKKSLKQHRRYEAIPIKTKLTEEEVARFAVSQYRYPGVQIKAQLIRYYPMGSALSSVIGYVGRISEHELLVVDPTNYSATNYIGKVGIEKYFEDILHGRVGHQQAETDATGRIVRVLKRTDPLPGKNIYLTIDSNLQKITFEAFGEKHGAAIAIDPRSGQILAMVNSPSYDPNFFVEGITLKDYQALQKNPDQPLFNRAIRGQYPLASTIKPFLGLKALETGVVTPEYGFQDPGSFKLKSNSHVYRDWKRGGHGWVNFKTALKLSCDIYYYNLSLKLGIENIDEVLNDFGFGNLTHVEMFEERPGLIPSPDWKKRTQKQSWYPGDTVISGIGQGFFLTTPLQLASATATLANQGQRFKPTLLFATQDQGAQQIPAAPIPLSTVQFQKANWDVVIDGMKEVILTGTGAVHFGNDAKYTVAGKTGTAQVYSLKQNERYNSEKIPEKLRDHSLFIAFAPVENPKIAVAVIAEHSTIAGNIARKMLDSYMSHDR